MRKRTAAAVIAIFVLVASIGVYAGLNTLKSRITLPTFGPACRVTADGDVGLDAVQMANAATIAAVGVRRNVPGRAVVVALATALQESGLENLPHGDRDSIGIFQQRPSQGWGSVQELSDPRAAARKFYHSLMKVKGWDRMRVTDAAQRVQRSAYPEAYEKWVADATVLTKALLGDATGAVACIVTGEPSARGPAAVTSLTEALKLDWGKPRTATTGTLGLTVSPDDDKAGWRYAHWLVAHATDHGVERVSFGDLEWHAPDGTWSQAAQPAPAGQVNAQVYPAR